MRHRGQYFLNSRRFGSLRRFFCVVYVRSWHSIHAKVITIRTALLAIFRLKGAKRIRNVSRPPDSFLLVSWLLDKIQWLRLSHQLIGTYYWMILVMTPAPTVRPPSRMANRLPASKATGTINSTFMFTLSPGITISTPSGNSTEPVTSIVRM